MSSLIHTVSYEEQAKKTFIEVLRDHLGLHTLTLSLDNGSTVSGLPSEIGKDYVILIDDSQDIVVPVNRIVFIQYNH